MTEQRQEGPELILTVEESTVHLKGKNCPPGAYRVFIQQRDAIGNRSSTHKATVASENHPSYALGDVDFTEKLQHMGDVTVRVEDADGVEVCSEVFHLGG